MGTKPAAPQTDYTTAGKRISDKQVANYQDNLKRQGYYLDNIQNRQDPYTRLGDISSASTMRDFQDAYNRDMASTMEGQYNNLKGGYSSAGQNYVDKQQAYYDALATDIYGQLQLGKENMAQNEWNLLSSGNQILNNAYGLGAAHSDIEQYNATKDGSWWDQYGRPAQGAAMAVASVIGAMFTGGATLAMLPTAAKMMGSSGSAAPTMNNNASTSRAAGTVGNAMAGQQFGSALSSGLVNKPPTSGLSGQPQQQRKQVGHSHLGL